MTVLGGNRFSLGVIEGAADSLAVPLVVIETYEHAFDIDYQNRKAEYVEKFMAHIDWNEANARYRWASR